MEQLDFNLLEKVSKGILATTIYLANHAKAFN